MLEWKIKRLFAIKVNADVRGEDSG